MSSANSQQPSNNNAPDHHDPPEGTAPNADELSLGTTSEFSTSGIDHGATITDDNIAVPYRAADFPYPDREIWDTPIPHIADEVVKCVEVEGPIHQDLLLRRISSMWGYQRAGSRIARYVDEATTYGIRRQRIRLIGEFLWPAREVDLTPRGAAENGTLREINHVPDEEIAHAILAILERAFSLSPDDLIVQCSRVFGFQRTGRDIRARILTVARAMYKSGQVDFKGTRVQRGRSTGTA